jgi:hypothetical protein
VKAVLARAQPKTGRIKVEEAFESRELDAPEELSIMKFTTE